MSTREILIRVTAAADPSLRSVFSPLVQSAARARAAVEKEGQRQASAVAKEAQRGATAAARASEQISKALAKRDAEGAASAERAAAKRTRAELRAFDERLRASAKARAAEERDIESIARARTKALRESARLREADERDERRQRKRIGGEAVGNLAALGRHAVGLGTAVAGGMGVQFDVQSHVANAVGLAAMSTKIANEGYQPGRHERVDPKVVEQSIKDAADAAGFSREGAAAGLQEFTKSTGDLGTGLEAMKQLGPLAQAANVDFGELMDGAGKVSAALGDIPNKGQVVVDIMKSIAGQGKLGAITVSMVTEQMSKLAGAAASFEGDKGQNITLLNAMAEISKQHGGSGTVPAAVNAVASLQNTFLNPKTHARFSALGIDTINERTQQIRDPSRIVEEALLKTGGDKGLSDITKMKALFTNPNAWRAVAGQFDTFNRAGGGKAGIAALHSELSTYGVGATIGDSEIKSSLAARMGDDDVKAQLMNNRFDDVAENLEQRLAPALEKLAPKVVELANAFADIVVWAAENPGEAIVTAIVASVGKAAIGEMVGNTISGSLSGPLGQVAATFTAAAAAFIAGKHEIDSYLAEQNAGDNRTLGALNDASNTLSAAHMGRAGGSNAELEKRIADIRARIQLGEASKDETHVGGTVLGGVTGALFDNATNGMLSGMISSAASSLTNGYVGKSAASQADEKGAAKELPQLRAMLADLTAQLKRQQDSNAPITAHGPVTITGPVSIHGGSLGPAADQSGRSP